MGHVIVENLVGRVSFIHGAFIDGIEDLGRGVVPGQTRSEGALDRVPPVAHRAMG